MGKILSSLSPDDKPGQPCNGGAYVLDDEPQIGALVCKALHGCGLVPRQFTSAAPFLAELKISPPGLIVLDLSLGQSDAVEIIRDLEVLKYQGKVLLISGRDETTLNEIAQIGERHGLAMLSPLQKPFRAADLKQRLSSHAADAMRPEARDPPIDSTAPQKALVEVAEALRSNWLELWYQPKIDLKSLSVCGAEGLIRARHPQHGVITPDRLLPPVGDPGYGPLTEFVIKRAMADWGRFARRGLYVNLSVNAPFGDPICGIHFARAIGDAKRSELSGLVLEVTEDEVIRDGDRRAIATQLKLYNVGLSIDDFGSGYAALASERPAIVEVKIDRSFVRLLIEQLKYGLCQTVVDLAHRFATACAEGVETVEDLRALVGMQCDLAQGFLLAKPMPPNELESTLLAWSEKSMRALLQTSPGRDRGLAQSASGPGAKRCASHEVD